MSIRRDFMNSIREGQSTETLKTLTIVTGFSGDRRESLSSGTTVYGLVQDFGTTEEYERFGEYTGQRIKVFLPPDTVVSENDRIVYGSLNYIVEEVVKQIRKDTTQTLKIIAKKETTDG